MSVYVAMHVKWPAMQCNNMGCKETVSAKVDPDWKDRIEEHRESAGHDTRSEAVVDLVKTGYREKHHPLMYRAKQQSKDVAVYLPLVGATVAIIGQATAALDAATGYQIAVILICLAVTPLALLEGVQRAMVQMREGRA